MKIVVLDGYTCNPGDLTWEKIGSMGELEVYDHTPFRLIEERAKDAEVIFTNKTPLNKDTIQKLDKLKYVCVLATGYNIVDTDAAKERGILVSNIPAYSTNSVAQMTFALILELCHHVQAHSSCVREGSWSQCRDFCFWNYPLVELAGKTLGIIGFGSIGQQVADIAAAFGMQVIGYSRTQTDQSHRKGFRWGTFETLMKESDVVSLHCPLFPENRGMINYEALALMKKSAFLVNTARGPLIEEADLARALEEGLLAGAAVDVLSTEPPKDSNPLLDAPNCIITPHISWATKEARTRLMKTAEENLKAFVEGNPINVVNK